MAKKQVVQVVDDDEDEEVELEELSEDDEAPVAKSAKKKAKVEDDFFGVRNGLIPLLKQKTGKDYTPREVRTLLRKLARGGEGVERDIVAGNKTRYEWSGPEDPEVKVILKAVKGGQIESAKKAALDKLKADKAAKQAKSAVEPVSKKAAAAGKKKKVVVEVDEDEDDDDDE